jgi:hypothetical protein
VREGRERRQGREGRDGRQGRQRRTGEEVRFIPECTLLLASVVANSAPTNPGFHFTEYLRRELIGDSLFHCFIVSLFHSRFLSIPPTMPYQPSFIAHSFICVVLSWIILFERVTHSHFHSHLHPRHPIRDGYIFGCGHPSRTPKSLPFRCLDETASVTKLVIARFWLSLPSVSAILFSPALAQTPRLVHSATIFPARLRRTQIGIQLCECIQLCQSFFMKSHSHIKKSIIIGCS